MHKNRSGPSSTPNAFLALTSGTDDDYFAFIYEHSKTSHHCAGTCRMGVDAGAVVDPRLRFNGIEGLRVVDNAIMPRVISSNTNAAAIMIGEKAADMIKQDHGG